MREADALGKREEGLNLFDLPLTVIHVGTILNLFPHRVYVAVLSSDPKHWARHDANAVALGEATRADKIHTTQPNFGPATPPKHNARTQRCPPATNFRSPPAAPANSPPPRPRCAPPAWHSRVWWLRAVYMQRLGVGAVARKMMTTR